MYFFSTYFDTNYLSRGLVLYDSIKKHCTSFKLYILCLDDNTFNYFFNKACRFPEIITTSMNEIEVHDNELKECKKNRSTIEYYFTLSPCFPLYLLNKYNLPHICSLDADIMFFSSPEIIFSYLENYSILITPHNFSQDFKSHEIYGLYNVSFQIFKNDTEGLKCLEEWKQQCIDWCYDKLEDSKFADQKYLDDWVYKYDKVLPITILGSGIAPWNIQLYKITSRNSNVFINDRKLIFYHFHGLRILRKNIVYHKLNVYEVMPKRHLVRYIYRPYIKKLLSNKLTNDANINRNDNHTKSLLRTLAFEENWFYYKAGILFKPNVIFRVLGRMMIRIKNLQVKGECLS